VPKKPATIKGPWLSGRAGWIAGQRHPKRINPAQVALANNNRASRTNGIR